MSSAKVDFVHPVSGPRPAGSRDAAAAGLKEDDPEDRLHRVRVMEREMAVGFSGLLLELPVERHKLTQKIQKR